MTENSNIIISLLKINSARKAGKFVQVGPLVMGTCISDEIPAYQEFFHKKLRGDWNNTKNVVLRGFKVYYHYF